MHDLTKRIQNHFVESIATKDQAGKMLTDKIMAAAILLVNTIKAHNKILCCGNGGSACDAEHFVGELINRLQIERRPLPALSLNSNIATITAIANDYSYTQIFSKQVEALGNKGDVLLAISTSGNSENVLEAVKVAQHKGLKVIALTGNDGGKLKELLDKDDVVFCVPSKINIRIQETHILIIHILCDLIDYQLFVLPANKTGSQD